MRPLATLIDGVGLNRRRGGRGAQLLVLNYHRIGEPSECPFDREIISATPEQFEAQLAFVKRATDVIDVADVPDVIAARRRGRFVLITFDDGYADNARVAAPMLRSHELPAAFFLTTGFLDERRPAWWDEIAWIVRHCEREAVSLDGFGLTLDVAASRGSSIREAIERYKALPPEKAALYVDALADACGTGRCPDEAAERLWMTWEDAREMASSGFTIGGHTVTHPVLSRLSQDAQREEIAGCRRRIREELSLEPDAFSYPVGQPDSFTHATKTEVEAAGFTIAFSFYGGVCVRGHVDPLNVPRVAVETRLRGPLFRSRVAWPYVFGGL